MEPSATTPPASAIPHYCAVQDPAEYERQAAIFNALRRQAAFAMQHAFRRSALFASLANRFHLTVAQCEEFTPNIVPQLATYQPRILSPESPEEAARKAAELNARITAEKWDRARRESAPVVFRTVVEACAFFQSNSEGLEAYLRAHPELLKTI